MVERSGDGRSVDELATLAMGLCQDARIGVELHPTTWAWDPVRRMILLSAEDLRSRGVTWCVGVIAHETGHFFISRYGFMQTRFADGQALRQVLNAIEDPRVDAWMGGRYPGAGQWLEHVAHEDLVGANRGVMPLFDRFCAECVLEAARGWQAAPDTDRVPDQVAQALAQTRPARHGYVRQAPAPDLRAALAPAALREAYRAEVVPRLRSSHAARWPTPREQDVRLSAARALDLAEAEILPVALALHRADVDQVAGHLTAHPDQARVARAALNAGHGAELGALLREALWRREGPVPPAPRSMVALATELLEGRMRGRSREPLTARPAGPAPVEPGQRVTVLPAPPRSEPRGAGRPPGPGEGLTLPRMPQAAYNQALERVANQVDDLAGRLERLLAPRRRLRARSGYASGQRVDLRALMAAEADPRLLSKVWTRRSIPDRREAIISLLVDLSGSMYGEKAEHALLGTVLLAEVMERLQLRYAINGFQDELIPLCDFDQRLDAQARQAISELVLEVSGDRPRGRNHPSFNDDGPCVAQAARALLAQAGSDRVLIVVSDGQPAGRHSGDAELRATIAALREEPLDLVGIGLGPDTEHVRSFYSDAIANVPVARFAERIGALLDEVLTPQGGSGQTA